MTLFEILLYSFNPDVAQASSILIISAVIGAAGTAYGASQNKKASKANAANQDAFLAAQQLSEAEARELYDGLIKEYNKSKEKAEGLSIRDYIGTQVEALNNPELKKAFYSSREEDFAVAQRWAGQASKINASVFNKVVDEVGGGSYKNLITARNNAILGDDINKAYSRAAELRNTRIPAGSVRKGPDGAALPNSRADKFEFGIAYEEVQKANDRIFAKSTQAINDDRTAAERQMEHASTFLPMLDYNAFVTNSVTSPFNQSKLSLAVNALNNDAALAQAALGKAVQNPLAPQTLNANQGDAMIAQGTQLATAAIGQYFSNQKTSGGYSTSQGTGSNSYNLDHTMGSGSGPTYG